MVNPDPYLIGGKDAEYTHGITLTGAPDEKFGEHDGYPDHYHAQQVEQDKQAAAIFPRRIGELSDISQADGAAGGEDESQARGPMGM